MKNPTVRPAHLNFKLGHRETLTTPDPMDRDWLGWDPTATHQAHYERNRGVWILGQAAERSELATFSHDGSVKVVIAMTGLETIPALEAGGRAKTAFIGRVLAPGDTAYDQLIDAPVDSHRNPVTYVPATFPVDAAVAQPDDSTSSPGTTTASATNGSPAGEA